MKTYFPEVTKTIGYEGPSSKNPLAYRFFDPKRKVGDKTMGEHLKFAVAYWHTFRGTGADPFGGGSYNRPWGQESNAIEAAESTLDASFEFTSKLGLKHYCFHDRDMAPEGDTPAASAKNLEHLVKRAKEKQAETGVKLMWGTANLFSHPRYTHGAMTNPDPLVMAHAASQVRHAIDATVELGGTGYVFWGGREGYSTLLNTDMKREREQAAAFMHMAVDYAKRVGFKGMFFIEPKPAEPSTHQYDYDAATTLGFLREFGLMDNFALNLEANHATLAKHTFEHELITASIAGKLGSLDINRGNPILGWDTDQFPTDAHSATLAMWIILRQGGLTHGGLNFDSKVRRGSFDSLDLFHAHVGGVDTYARALLVANKIHEDGVLDGIIAKRYAGFDGGIGRDVLSGKAKLEDLEKHAQSQGEPKFVSGREEALENVLNDYLYCTRIE